MSNSILNAFHSLPHSLSINTNTLRANFGTTLNENRGVLNVSNNMNTTSTHTPAEAVALAKTIITEAGGFSKLTPQNLEELAKLETYILQTVPTMQEYAEIRGTPFAAGSAIETSLLNKANAVELLNYQIGVVKAPFVKNGPFEAVFLQKANGFELYLHQLYVARAPFVEGSAYEMAFLQKARAEDLLLYQQDVLNYAPFVEGSAYEAKFLQIANGSELLYYRANFLNAPFTEGSAVHKAFLANADGHYLLAYQQNVVKAPFVPGSAAEKAFLAKASPLHFLLYQQNVVKTAFEDGSVYKKAFFEKIDALTDSELKNHSYELNLYSTIQNTPYPTNSKAHAAIKTSTYWGEYKTRFNIED